MNKLFARCFVLSVILSTLTTVGCLSSETKKVDDKHIYGLNDENSIMLCTDGIDNDNDTLIDCNDAGCRCSNSSIIEECPSSHPGATVCPGAVDPDSGIWEPAENTVFACSDGKDNDGNGYADCKDNNCKKTAACCVKSVDVENGDTCDDGIDNDCNGYIDCADNNCKKTEACCTPTGSENTPEACSDGIDNDCNGYADCNDNNCKKNAACCTPIGSENSLDTCMDGLDNDCNGYIDCRDNNCKNSPDRDITLYCCTPTTESTLQNCTDGVDNDCDGYLDCNDASCYELMDAADLEQFKSGCANQGVSLDHTLVEELEIQEYFAELKKGVPLAFVDYNETTCSDKMDNDLNGLIDCADSNCIETEYCKTVEAEPAPRPTGFESLTTEQKKAILAQEKQLCEDGIDNNKNGKTDCEDYDCRILSVRSQSYTGDYAPFVINCQDISQPDETPDAGDDH